jgi:hypothetical protein
VRWMTTTATACALLAIGLAHAGAAPGTVATTSEPASVVLWDIGAEGRFDATNMAYPIASGTVTVDLSKRSEMCPTGLGHLASGRDSIRRLTLGFTCPAAGSYWLHVRWNGGGSGVEQFEVLLDGRSAGRSQRIEAEKQPDRNVSDRFALDLAVGRHEIVLAYLTGDGMRIGQLALTGSAGDPAPSTAQSHPAERALPFPSLEAYEKAIGGPGILLDNEHVRLFAPAARQREAKIIHTLLVKAYGELRRLTGVDTRFAIVVYHFPEDSPNFSGGTSNCVIRYGYKNLDLASWPEWTQHGVPHVSGYIEEMAHNFVDAARVQFGWEMVGWSLGIEATRIVADNPMFEQGVRQTRVGQEQTFRRYVRSGCVYPADLPANQVDRIHAHLLGLCRQRCGPRFWPDFFAEVAKRRDDFVAAARLSGDESRNARYKLSIECFEAVKGLHFRAMLREYAISDTTDVKALHPEDPGWDRRLVPASERR